MPGPTRLAIQIPPYGAQRVATSQSCMLHGTACALYLCLSDWNARRVVSRLQRIARLRVVLQLLNQYRQLVIRDRIGNSQAKALSANHWYIDSYYYMTALVIRGVGWALVPEHIANSEWYTGDIIELSTEYIPTPLLVEIGVVNRRDQAYGPVMEWIFLEIESMFRTK